MPDLYVGNAGRMDLHKYDDALSLNIEKNNKNVEIQKKQKLLNK